VPSDVRTWVGGDYVQPFTGLIKQLKFGGAHSMAIVLASALTRQLFHAIHTGEADEHDLPDVLVPIPVSAGRLRQRGYNQALLIARALGSQLQRPVWPLMLVKQQETSQQARLGARDRQANLADAFCVRGELTGLHVGLVDDVLTTGATLAVCGQLLQKAGARRISQWTGMRTPEKPDDQCDPA
jgi:ComF family protein